MTPATEGVMFKTAKRWHATGGLAGRAGDRKRMEENRSDNQELKDITKECEDDAE